MQDFLAVGVVFSGALPSPLGEGVCGPDRRRMRGSLAVISRKRAAAETRTSSAAAAAPSPQGEGLGLYISSSLSAVSGVKRTLSGTSRPSAMRRSISSAYSAARVRMMARS